LTREATEWADRGARRVRLWCAAAATGEEPWTLAVTLAEALGARGIDWKILATDISTRALATAQEAKYRAHQLGNVAAPVRNRYFEAAEGGAEKLLAVRQELRAQVMFRRLNLAKPPFPLRGGLDAVFCRNVMIYFDQPVRQALISEIEKLLKPGGLLFIGHSETLNGVRSQFTMVDPAVYRKPGGP
jgi:chemotaxis protein methyltransferase CheR